MHVVIDIGVLRVAEVDVNVKSVLPLLAEERIAVVELERRACREVDAHRVYK